MNVAEIKNDLILQILRINDPLLLEQLTQSFHQILTNLDNKADISDSPEALLEAEDLEDIRLYDQVKSRRKEHIPLAEYLAKREARAHA